MKNKINTSKLLSRLTRGDISRIAEETGLSKPTISNHLKGEVAFPSKLIIDAAIRVIKRREAHERKLAEAVQL